MSADAHTGRLAAAGLFAAVVLIWGSTWFAIHLQDNGTPATAAVAIRFVLAAALMWAWVLVGGRRVRMPREAWPDAVVHGLTFFCFNYLLIYLGTQSVPSGLVSVLFSSTILFSLAWETVLFRAFPGWSALLAALLGIAGLALLFQHEIVAGAIDPRGAAIIVAAAAVAATGNIWSQRLLKRGIDILSLQTVGMTLGALATCAIAFARGELAAVVPEPAFIGALLYLAVFGSVVAFALYFLLVRRLGPTRAAYTTVFFPLVALVLSALFEGWTMTPAGGAGVLLLLAGAALIIGRRR